MLVTRSRSNSRRISLCGPACSTCIQLILPVDLMRLGKKLVIPAPALVLFDIDGTLIRRAGPHHRQALVDAVRHVTGLDTTTDHIPVHGMLDPDILTRMMLDAGATRTRIREAMPDVIGKAQSLYARRCPDLSQKICPG